MSIQRERNALLCSLATHVAQEMKMSLPRSLDTNAVQTNSFVYCRVHPLPISQDGLAPVNGQWLELNGAWRTVGDA